MHITYRSSCLLLVAGILLFALPGATCVPTFTLTPGTDNGDSSTDGGGGSNVDTSGFADQVIDLVNAQRTANGLQPLVKNDLLTQAAQTYAKRMSDLNFFSHTDPQNNQGPAQRAEQAGYIYTYIAENLAGGYATPQDVVANWMNSPVHRENILLPQVTETGVGVYKGSGTYGTYWVQMFGSPG